MFKRSVLTQFLLLLVPVYGLLFFGFNTLFKAHAEVRSDEVLFHKAFTITNTVALLAAAPLGEKRPDIIPVLMSTLVADRDIEAIRIEGLSGDAVYSYGSFDNVSDDLIHKEIITYANRNGIHNVGKVTLGVTRTRMESLIDEVHAAILLGGISLLCLLIISVILVYHLTVARQLRSLIGSIRQYQKTGVHEDAPASSDHHLGEVIRAYNAMQTQSAQQRHDLERYNQDLEASVDIRTKAYAEESARHKQTADKLSGFIDNDSSDSATGKGTI